MKVEGETAYEPDMLVCMNRFEEILGNKKFLSKIFTEKEIEYCMKRADPKKHFAVRFAGKEAIIKALSSAGKKISVVLKVRDLEDSALKLDLHSDQLREVPVKFIIIKSDEI